MRVGLTIFLTDQTIHPAELAREAEARGFDSLWVPEHTHMPVEHSQHPAGGDLPDEYRRCLDPFVALTAAATATETLRVGTAICLVAQHDPIVLAKSVATLDHLSGGRFEFGVGYGWNRPECEDHGVAFSERRDALRDRILAMKALWAEEVATSDRPFASFEPSWAWPKPVQQPHPPILMGGALGPRTLAAVVEFCDGLMPIGGSGLDENVARVRQAFEEAGRDPDSARFSVVGGPPSPGKLEHFASLGADRTVCYLPTGPRDETLAALDAYTEASKDYLG